MPANKTEESDLSSSMMIANLSINQLFALLDEHQTNSAEFPSKKENLGLDTFDVINQYLAQCPNDTYRCQLLDSLLDSDYLDKCDSMMQQARSSENDVLDGPLKLASALQQRKHQIRYETQPERTIVAEYRAVNQPVISVIMPVYNSMPYLKEALDSILSQSLENIEIICINDGSTDDSLQHLVAVAKDDPRLCVVSQENRGQSSARNFGMSLAKGTYLYFMDSDDTLERPALRTLLELAEEQQLDLLCFDAVSVYESDELRASYPKFQNAYQRSREYSDVSRGFELLARMKDNGDYAQSPCLYLTRKQLIECNGIRFIEGILHEDNAFTFDCFIYAKRASHIRMPFFHRRIRNGSTMTSPTKFIQAYGYFRCFEEMLRTACDQVQDIPSESRGSVLRVVYGTLSSARSSFKKLSLTTRSAMYGLSYDMKPFLIAVSSPATTSQELKRSRKQLKRISARLEKENGTHTPRLLRRIKNRLHRMIHS